MWPLPSTAIAARASSTVMSPTKIRGSSSAVAVAGRGGLKVAMLVAKIPPVCGPDWYRYGTPAGSLWSFFLMGLIPNPANKIRIFLRAISCSISVGISAMRASAYLINLSRG